MTTTTSVTTQLNAEFSSIDEAVSKFSKKADKSITSTSLSKTLNLFGRVDEIATFLVTPVVKKQGLREVNVTPISTFSQRTTKKVLSEVEGLVEYLTTAENDKDLKAKWNTFVHIALSTMFDGAFASQENRDIHPQLPNASMFTKIIDQIGFEIEILFRMNTLKSIDKDAFNKVFYGHFADQALPQDVHLSMAAKQLQEIKPEWEVWSEEIRARLGTTLLTLVLSTYKDNSPFEVKVETIKGHRYAYLLPSTDIQEQVEACYHTSIDSDNKGLSDKLMVKRPMLTLPAPWSEGVSGGYITNTFLDRDSVVRGHNLLGESSAPSQMVFDFINNLQNVGYQVNQFTLTVANTLAEMGVSVGKFQPKSALSKANPWNTRKTVRTRDTLDTANQFKDGEFFIPWSLDFRGRTYPLVSYLSPQGTDFDKGLMMFSNGQELNADGLKWLKIHVANCFGNDKVSLQERQDWVDNNLEMIKSIAADPIGQIDAWKKVAEPWTFLAACKELVDVILDGKVSHLMVASDATCSGLQVLAGLSLDRDAAIEVNVVPSEERKDAYLAVAEIAKAKLAEDGKKRLVDYLTRKVCKKVVMTVPYNAAERTNADQVSDSLKEGQMDLPKEERVKFSSDDVTAITGAIISSVRAVVPGPMKLRDALNDAVQDMFNADAPPTTISWVTPSGMKVVQEKVKQKTVELNATLMGRQRLSIAVGPELDKNSKPMVKESGHKTSFMPNLIHSLDASLLALTFNNVEYEFSAIHDSILTHANDMDKAITGLKESYATIFKDREYLQYLQNDVLLSVSPLVTDEATFDSSEVMDSEFFFS